MGDLGDLTDLMKSPWLIVPLFMLTLFGAIYTGVNLPTHSDQVDAIRKRGPDTINKLYDIIDAEKNSDWDSSIFINRQGLPPEIRVAATSKRDHAQKFKAHINETKDSRLIREFDYIQKRHFIHFMRGIEKQRPLPLDLGERWHCLQRIYETIKTEEIKKFAARHFNPARLAEGI